MIISSISLLDVFHGILVNLPQGEQENLQLFAQNLFLKQMRLCYSVLYLYEIMFYHCLVPFINLTFRMEQRTIKQVAISVIALISSEFQV